MKKIIEMILLLLAVSIASCGESGSKPLPIEALSQAETTENCTFNASDITNGYDAASCETIWECASDSTMYYLALFADHGGYTAPSRIEGEEPYYWLTWEKDGCTQFTATTFDNESQKHSSFAISNAEFSDVINQLTFDMQYNDDSSVHPTICYRTPIVTTVLYEVGVFNRNDDLSSCWVKEIPDKCPSDIALPFSSGINLWKKVYKEKNSDVQWADITIYDTNWPRELGFGGIHITEEDMANYTSSNNPQEDANDSVLTYFGAKFGFTTTGGWECEALTLNGYSMTIKCKTENVSCGICYDQLGTLNENSGDI